MTVQGSGRFSRTDVRGGTYRPRRSRGASAWRGILVVGILAAVVVGGAIYFGVPAFRDFARTQARENPQAIGWPFVGDVIKQDLGEQLETPAGTDSTPVEFIVPEGASVTRIADDLVADELLTDPLVFQYLVITQNAEGNLQTGTFTLNQAMPPQAIVDRLQLPPDPPPAQVTVSLRDGLRIEQITALLESLEDLELDTAQFYRIATEPPDWVREEYPWLSAIPRDRSLEGFMGQGVFAVDRDISPEDLLRTLLDDAQTQFQPFMDEAEAADKDFYEVMTLASIVEKEAALDEERPLIAGVYQNRLDGKAEDGVRLLNADPTVIYANDTMQLRDMPMSLWPEYSFWELIDTPSLAGFEVSEDLQGYQTYQVVGLPPGPIATPGEASVEAALDPDTNDDYVYFVACGGEGAHRFAKTFREHNRNVAECQS